MVRAFVLINVEIGTEDAVLERLREMSEVLEAYTVYGTYDIISKVKVGSMTKLKNVVTGKVRQIEGARETTTLPILE